MANTINSIFLLLLVFINLLISTSAGRDIPSNKPDDIKHPDTFFSYDRGYLIPGLGRGIKPKSKKGFNPFTYNPITGKDNGIPGFSYVPSYGGVGGGSYVPGADDTLVPNPGFEAPSTGGGDSTPVPTSP